MGYAAPRPPRPPRLWRPRAAALLLAAGLCAAAALLSSGTLLPSAPATKAAGEIWETVPLVEAAGHPKPRSEHAMNVALVHARSKVERYEEGVNEAEERAAKHGGDDDAKAARRLKFERKELAKFTHLEESLVAERQMQLSDSVKEAVVVEEPKNMDGKAAADALMGAKATTNVEKLAELVRMEIKAGELAEVEPTVQAALNEADKAAQPKTKAKKATPGHSRYDPIFMKDNAFEVPKNHHLLIDIDPSKDPDMWKGADWDGEFHTRVAQAHRPP